MLQSHTLVSPLSIKYASVNLSDFVLSLASAFILFFFLGLLKQKSRSFNQ